MELNAQFVQQLDYPIRQVWNAIAADMDCSEMTNRDAIDTCIDCDRLETFCSVQDQQLIRAAIASNSYKEVVDLLTKNISLV